MRQYYHQNHKNTQKATVSVEIPNAQNLINLLPIKNDKLFLFQVGLALVHPNDRFNKKIGRETSDLKLKPLTLRLKLVEYIDICDIILVFESIALPEEKDRIHSLTFKVFSGSNKVYLIGAKVL